MLLILVLEFISDEKLIIVINKKIKHRYYSKEIFLNRNELAITETELKLIAAAAIIGESKIPKNGNKSPAAIGIPNTL